VKKQSKKIADILLLLCPFWITWTPSLGLAYIYAYLESKGKTAKILDINAKMFHKAGAEDRTVWQKVTSDVYRSSKLSQNILAGKNFSQYIEFYAKKIIASKIKVIGFSVNICNVFFSLELARQIKNKDQSRVIIFGGPLVNLLTPGNAGI